MISSSTEAVYSSTDPVEGVSAEVESMSVLESVAVVESVWAFVDSAVAEWVEEDDLRAAR